MNPFPAPAAPASHIYGRIVKEALMANRVNLSVPHIIGSLAAPRRCRLFNQSTQSPASREQPAKHRAADADVVGARAAGTAALCTATTGAGIAAGRADRHVRAVVVEAAARNVERMVRHRSEERRVGKECRSRWS